MVHRPLRNRRSRPVYGMVGEAAEAIESVARRRERDQSPAALGEHARGLRHVPGGHSRKIRGGASELAVAMSILRCCAIALAAPFAAAALAAGESALKPLTFADLPPIQEPTVALLDWSGDSKSLYATERERGAAATRVVKIDVATGKRSTVGEYAGQGFSLSPRRDLLVHFDAGEWKLVDLASGNAEALFKSPGFQFLP